MNEKNKAQQNYFNKKLNINCALINIILNIGIPIKPFSTQRQNIIAYFNILANLKIKIDIYIFVNGFFEHMNHLTNDKKEDYYGFIVGIA